MTDMKEENRIGRNIQSCCMQQGLSYYALARKAGIPLTTLLHILDGTSRNPGVYTLLRICGPLLCTCFHGNGNRMKKECLL